jgi:hypothetical protein
MTTILEIADPVVKRAYSAARAARAGFGCSGSGEASAASSDWLEQFGQ